MAEMRSAKRVKLVHIATVAQVLDFFHGQIGYLRARGFDVDAIASPGELAERFREREGIPVHTLMIAREINPARDVATLYRLWRLLRVLRPDIVHSHTPKGGLLGTIAARAAGVKVVVLSIFGLPQMTRTGFSRRLLDLTTRLSCRLADRVWVDSFSMRDYVVRQRLCAAERVVVLGQGSVNGVDAEGVFSPAANGRDVRGAIRTRYGIPDDALVLGFVGRIVADKGMHELAAAWRRLRGRYPALHLFLVGPFESQDALLPEDAATFRTDNRVHLAGRRSDVAPHLAAMDLFVMPSYREGFGIANIEAAAMALPVISTRIPGCVDSVQDQVTGTLIPVRDVGALVAAIEAYCDDPALRRAHGLAGRERVLRDFRQEVIWEALYREYTLLLQERGLPLPRSTAGEELVVPHDAEGTP